MAFEEIPSLPLPKTEVEQLPEPRGQAVALSSFRGRIAGRPDWSDMAGRDDHLEGYVARRPTLTVARERRRLVLMATHTGTASV